MAAQGDAADRGWSLLHPTTRRDMFLDDGAAYEAAAAANDWEGFSWRVREVEYEDGDLYKVYLELDAAQGAPPSVLTDRRGNLWLLSLGDEHIPPHIAVRVGQVTSGILAFGG